MYVIPAWKCTPKNMAVNFPVSMHKIKYLCGYRNVDLHYDKTFN